MDTTETIILTSVVNIIITGLVGGLIIYRIHKKIDNSYAKQLKEFEAELQYSNFEQQTKFAAIHAKRVEALEGLYQNYVSFIEAVDKVIVGMKAAQDKKLTIGTLEWNRHKEHLTGKLGDFRNYFQTNRFFCLLVLMIRYGIFTINLNLCSLPSDYNHIVLSRSCIYLTSGYFPY